MLAESDMTFTMLWQLHGLDLACALSLGAEAGSFSNMDVTLFTRLQKLQLRSFNSERATALGWRLGLPPSLRVLHVDGLEAKAFHVSRACHASCMSARNVPIPAAAGCAPFGTAAWAEVPWSAGAGACAVSLELTTFMGFTRHMLIDWSQCWPASCPSQGVSISHLTNLQELRISTGISVETLRLHLAGLPPSLRRVRVTHGHKPPFVLPKLILVASEASDLVFAASDPFTSHAETICSCHAASQQPAAPAAPELLSLDLHSAMTALPASWPLAASCAVTLHAAFLTVTLSSEDSGRVGSDRERVSSPVAVPLSLLTHIDTSSCCSVFIGVLWGLSAQGCPPHGLEHTRCTVVLHTY